jgi:hypothetical protein
MIQAEVVKGIKTHIICSITFPESHAVYEIMCENIVEPDRPQIIRCIRISCWIIKATHTHTQNVQYLLLFRGNDGYANAPYFMFVHCLSCFD